ncbi:hypothetical protein OG762_03565 [Streptomyces sp. NBC_01136]|nr:hypothetical protein OG762_03565 [Streptomyces sp. NBC_01136]
MRSSGTSYDGVGQEHGGRVRVEADLLLGRALGGQAHDGFAVVAGEGGQGGGGGVQDARPGRAVVVEGQPQEFQAGAVFGEQAGSGGGVGGGEFEDDGEVVGQFVVGEAPSMLSVPSLLR